VRRTHREMKTSVSPHGMTVSNIQAMCKSERISDIKRALGLWPAY